MKVDERISIEQFEARLSRSTVPSPHLSVAAPQVATKIKEVMPRLMASTGGPNTMAVRKTKDAFYSILRIRDLIPRATNLIDICCLARIRTDGCSNCIL